jgi:rare lipoprotein A
MLRFRFVLGVIAGALIVAFAAFWFVPGGALAMGCAGQVGKASFYAEAHQGKIMANGKPFNMYAFTAASNSLPLGARARVSNGRKHVNVTITDTGGFGKYGRIIDLSRAAFAKLAPTAQGIIKHACVERLS